MKLIEEFDFKYHIIFDERRRGDYNRKLKSHRNTLKSMLNIKHLKQFVECFTHMKKVEFVSIIKFSNIFLQKFPTYDLRKLEEHSFSYWKSKHK